jgi:hypothetical protein
MDEEMMKSQKHRLARMILPLGVLGAVVFLLASSGVPTQGCGGSPGGSKTKVSTGSAAVLTTGQTLGACTVAYESELRSPQLDPVQNAAAIAICHDQYAPLRDQLFSTTNPPDDTTREYLKNQLRDLVNVITLTYGKEEDVMRKIVKQAEMTCAWNQGILANPTFDSTVYRSLEEYGYAKFYCQPNADSYFERLMYQCVRCAVTDITPP